MYDIAVFTVCEEHIAPLASALEQIATQLEDQLDADTTSG